MATKNKKEFSSKTCGKLDFLYDSTSDIMETRVNLKMDSINLTLKEIQAGMIDHPFVATEKKDNNLELEFGNDDFKEVLDKFPKGNESIVCEIVKAKNFDSVKFAHSEIKAGGRYLPPRFLIDLSGEDFTDRVGVRVNTGCVVKIKPVAMGKIVENGKLVNTKYGKQVDAVVIPIIVSSTEGICQNIYARDPEDTGLLTINFTIYNLEKFKQRKLQVVLYAYHTIRPLKSASIIDSETISNELFKPKDSKSGRYVKNPKIKYFSNDFLLDDPRGPLRLKTFNSTKKPIECFEKQQIKIEGVITLFTNRKREWCTSDLACSGGIFNPFTGKHVVPKIAKGSSILANTHGMVFIKSKIPVYSIDGGLTYDLRFLNGAFKNMAGCDYTTLSKQSRKFVESLNGLSVGAKMCKGIAEKLHLDFEKLMRVLDYHRTIDETDDGLKLKMEMKDEELYNSRPSDSLPYSNCLYKALKYFAYVFCKDKLTPEVLDVISLEYSKVDDEPPAKRRKL